MKTLHLIQGSPEWLAARARYFTASEAPAMLGLSKYKTRTELLREKATGLISEVDAATQARFDAGHRAEEAARPLIEALIGEELYPATGTLEIEGLPLLASFDGLTMAEDRAWENKLYRDDLAAAILAGEIDGTYWPQLEQQLLVSGAEKVYFTASDGTAENTVGTWYVSQPERRAALIAGWKQFSADLAEYQHIDPVAKPVGQTVEALPVPFVQVEGRVVASNMTEFKAAASAFLARLPKHLETDQDFADAEKAVKACKEAEAKLVAVKEAAQAQAVSIDEVFRTLDGIKAQVRDARLALEKQVGAEKEARRAEIVRTAQDQIKDHIGKLNARLGGAWMPAPNLLAFADAIKGLKSLDSMRDKIGVALANAKIAANETADQIGMNMATYSEIAAGYEFLFPDLGQHVTKAAEDFEAVVLNRINQHAEKERQRAERQAKEASEKVEEDAERERKNAEWRNAAPAAANEPVAQAQVAEVRREAVIEHQDEIGAFMASREWGKEAGRIRAVLVEFVKFQAINRVSKEAA